MPPRSLAGRPATSPSPVGTTLSIPVSARDPIPSLQKLCLGQLGLYVRDVVELLGEDIFWLPVHYRSCLLVAARRRGLLTGALLHTLLDETGTSLDLSGCVNLRDDDVRSALVRLPRLQALDLSSCDKVCLGTLRVAARCCKELRTLRLGGSPTSDEVAIEALQYVLPRIEPLKGRATDDDDDSSWEDVADASTAVPESGRMTQLQYIVWPRIPPKASHLIASLCPRILVNPQLRTHATRKAAAAATAGQSAGGTSGRAGFAAPATVASAAHAISAAAAASGAVGARASATATAAAVAQVSRALVASMPEDADLATPLDEPLARCVGAAAWQGLPAGGAATAAAAQAGAGSGSGGADDIPLHERFRLAYVSRAATVRVREEQQYKRWQRRQYKTDAVLRATESWLDSEGPVAL